jgi:hypothetical protein
LRDLGYAAVSRSRGSRPKVPAELTDYFVNVDLHTRKERDPALGWHNLFNELQQGINSDRCGIMIHHQRMNAVAFDFLEMIIRVLVGRRELQLVNYRDLATTNNGPDI